MHAFRTYFDTQIATPIADADFAMVCDAFMPKQLKKKDFLLRPGEVCKHVAFVQQGALRLYSVDDKGGEHVLSFGVEQCWVGDRESYARLTPSPYYIDALEDADLLLVTYAQIQALVRTIPAMAELMRGLNYRHEIADLKRLQAVISDTVEGRYAALIAQHPDYLSRFPQRLIASYLGILPETLSRVRTKLLQAKSVGQGAFLTKVK
jgi:CRP-like cAMP-binding protein